MVVYYYCAMRHGFSLIEISIVLVIVGLMTTFALQFFGKEDGEACLARTREQLASIQAALQHFTTTQGRLPKPARAGDGSNNAQFGVEATGAIGDPADAAYATDVPSGVSSAGGVLIGTVPHSTLALGTSFAADCWGGKFTYAVTNALTSSNATTGYPSSAAGGITINSSTLGAPQLLSNSMAYVVVSHGMDQYGATPMSANDRTANHCNGSSEPKIDRENCNGDAIFFNSAHNTGTTGEYFDDAVVFGAKMAVAPACDSDASDGLTAGQKYCAGVVVAQATGNLVCSGGLWGASYAYTCGAGEYAQCQSGSASTTVSSDTSGCSPPPDCSSGNTFPTMGCAETSECICD